MSCGIYKGKLDVRDEDLGYRIICPCSKDTLYVFDSVGNNYTLSKATWDTWVKRKDTKTKHITPAEFVS